MIHVVRFITTFAISAHHHYSCEFESLSCRGALDTTLCDWVCQWLAAGRLFSPGNLVSFINKTDCHNITEILLKVALHAIHPLSSHKVSVGPHNAFVLSVFKSYWFSVKCCLCLCKSVISNIQWYLCKLNLLRTNYFVQNMQMFGLYRSN